MKIIAATIILLVLAGCNHNPPRTIDVIEAPRTCYATPAVPQLVEVNIEVQQLIDGTWAITIDDVNFNALLSNNLITDTYTENANSTLLKYAEECK